MCVLYSHYLIMRYTEDTNTFFKTASAIVDASNMHLFNRSLGNCRKEWPTWFWQKLRNSWFAIKRIQDYRTIFVDLHFPESFNACYSFFCAGVRHSTYRDARGVLHSYFFSWEHAPTRNLEVDWLDARNICRRHCMDAVSLETPQVNRCSQSIVLTPSIVFSTVAVLVNPQMIIRYYKYSYYTTSFDIIANKTTYHNETYQTVTLMEHKTSVTKPRNIPYQDVLYSLIYSKINTQRTMDLERFRSLILYQINAFMYAILSKMYHATGSIVMMRSLSVS